MPKKLKSKVKKAVKKAARKSSFGPLMKAQRKMDKTMKKKK